MKILVTGGSGFLGSHVADELTKKGHEVTIFDKTKSKWMNSKQKIILGNILNFKSLQKAVKGKDVVYHFAALGNIDMAMKSPKDTVKLNILATVNLLDLCEKNNIKRFVLASSIYVNSIDGGFYRSSKKAAEDYIEEFSKIRGLKFTILRYGSLYGPRADNANGVKTLIRDAIINKKASYIGNKNSIREYIHVKDAAQISARILNSKYKNKHLILTGRKKIKVREFLKKVIKILKIKKEIIFYNKKGTGHYIKSPYTFKPKIGKKIAPNKKTDFFEDIYQLVKEEKKNV